MIVGIRPKQYLSCMVDTPPEVALAYALAEQDPAFQRLRDEHVALRGAFEPTIFLLEAGDKLVETVAHGEMTNERLAAIGELIEAALVGDQVATDEIRFSFADSIRRSGLAPTMHPFLGPKLNYWIETS
jgi:hypothetical protein